MSTRAKTFEGIYICSRNEHASYDIRHKSPEMTIEGIYICTRNVVIIIIIIIITIIIIIIMVIIIDTAYWLLVTGDW